MQWLWRSSLKENEFLDAGCSNLQFILDAIVLAEGVLQLTELSRYHSDSLPPGWSEGLVAG